MGGSSSQRLFARPDDASALPSRTLDRLRRSSIALAGRKLLTWARDHGGSAMDGEWERRLADMEGWYRELLQSGDDAAEEALRRDYSPYRDFLSGLRGHVLDVGGGAGLASAYLSEASAYTVIDPAAVWEEPGWKAFSRRFHAERPPVFVKGQGEDLPFDDASFDAVLAFWSLNHVGRPQRCVAEMVRVLRGGGAMLIVLEDMIPPWSDVIHFTLARALRRGEHGRSGSSPWGRGVRASWLRRLSGLWPLQSDHIRIAEPELRRWIASGMRVCDRRWASGFLTYELEKDEAG
jgi:SAM-dependent methyltransferase